MDNPWQLYTKPGWEEVSLFIDTTAGWSVAAMREAIRDGVEPKLAAETAFRTMMKIMDRHEGFGASDSEPRERLGFYR